MSGNPEQLDERDSVLRDWLQSEGLLNHDGCTVDHCIRHLGKKGIFSRKKSLREWLRDSPHVEFYTWAKGAKEIESFRWLDQVAEG